MAKKNNGIRTLKALIVLFAALLILGLVSFFLADAGVIKANAFQLMFAVMAIGGGLTLVVYGVIVKGGYELAVGGLCFDVGVIIALIGVVRWYGIVLIAMGIAALLLLGLMFVKADYLIVKRTDEEQEENNKQ